MLGKRIKPNESIINLTANKKDPGAPKANETAPASTDQPAAKTTISFTPRKPLFTYANLILPKEVFEQLSCLRSRIENHELIYTEWGMREIDPQGQHIAFNLYGPSGTGKTMCVEAIAAELGKNIIDVSYAEIESKFVGDTGKNIVAAFRAAQEFDALLFFDEADSILGKRMTSVTQAADHGVNVARAVMLKQLDEFKGIVAFATNLAQNFDSAFIRRISQHIEIPLPDEHGRLLLWQKMLSNRVPGRDDLDWQELSKASEGFSGGDIKNAVVNALARVAARTGEQRRINAVDLHAEIDHIVKTKSSVGSEAVKIKERILNIGQIVKGGQP